MNQGARVLFPSYVGLHRGCFFRSKELEGEAGDLRERIKHLNDMVFCQQRKVKGMIEEVSRIYLSVCRPWIQLLCSTVLIVGVSHTFAQVACLPLKPWINVNAHKERRTSLHTESIKGGTSC